MNVFRKGTLYSLLVQVPSTIGRMARPNNIIEQNRRRNRSMSIAGRSIGAGRAEGSLVDDSRMSDADGVNNINFKRRGTVNLVKNFMFSKI